MKLATVCYVRKDGRTLMIKTRSKSFQRGVYNGVGGKLEQGETPDECNVREMKEEAEIDVKDAVCRGVVTFLGQDDVDWHVFFYTAKEYDGEPPDENREGKLEWLEDEKLLKYDLWPGDELILPWIEQATEEKRFFIAKVIYGENLVVADHQVAFH